MFLTAVEVEDGGAAGSHITRIALPDGNTLVVERGNGCPIYELDVKRAPHLVPKYRSYESIDLVPPAQRTTVEGEWLASSRGEHGRKKVSNPLTNQTTRAL